MTEFERAQRPAGDRPESQAEAVSRAANQNMMGQVLLLRQATDFNGDRCRQPIPSDQVPVMLPGADGNGCTYRPGNRGPGINSTELPAEMPAFNTAALYRQAQGESVRVNTISSITNSLEPVRGNGVIIGANGERCVVATTGETVQPAIADRVRGYTVTMPNGRTYSARVEIRDPANDRAALSVHTGPDTASVCRPARVAENAGERGPGWTTGYPGDSRSLYVAPTDIRGLSRAREWENPSAPGRRLPEVLETRANSARNNGGTIYNRNGEVVGLVSTHPVTDTRVGGTRVSIGVPFDRQLRDQWMETIRSRGR